MLKIKLKICYDDVANNNFLDQNINYNKYIF